MFKLFLWSAALATTGAAALFVPIDPAWLQAAGIIKGETGRPIVSPAGESPFKIISALPAPGQKAGITVDGEPPVSPYTAKAPVKVVAAPTLTRLIKASGGPPVLKIPRAPAVQAAPPAPAPANVVRRLQTELRRVGCYHGRIDGDWGPASRFAMAAFTRSVNAALPTDRPDIVLLTLVRRHTGVTCGANRAAPVQTAATVVPSARVKTTQAWRVRVAPAPAPARPRLAERPRLQERPLRLVETPRIVRGQGHQPATAATAAPASRYRAFNSDSRMALGVAPEPRRATRPVTAPVRPAAAPWVSRKRTAERRRARRARSVKRRRAWRRSRSQSWRQKAFPNFSN